MTHHGALGLRVGLTKEKIDALDNYEAGPYTELERLVIRFADDLTRRADVGDDLFNALKGHLTLEELVELSLSVGVANLTNRFNHALRIELEGRGSG